MGGRRGYSLAGLLVRDEALFQLLRGVDIPPRLIQRLGRDRNRNHRTRAGLSDNDLQVLRCFAHGLDTDLTADSLQVSRETVKAELSAIRGALNAKTTTHAVALAIRQGLIA
jgi:DNA-binding CsgD family transcriptional regulator